MIHERPDFITNFRKPKNTEIKYINGHWYLYERSAFYDPTTKKMHKKSGPLLGSITENGFCPRKPKMDHKSFENVNVVEAGADGYLWKNNSDMLHRLQKYFPDYWKELFVVAALRVTSGPRFKRLDDAYEASCLSVLIPGLNISRNSVSSILRSVGRRRSEIADFMREECEQLSSYVIFDGHRIISDSDTLSNAQKGYDTRGRFKRQVNLVYAFSISDKKCFPCFYKQFSGDIPDISAFSSLVREAGIKKDEVTFLADKGFRSEDNFALIDDSGFKYIIPIMRTDVDAKDNLPLSHVGYDESFMYQSRAVLHKEIKKSRYSVHLYMDTALFANEINDFISRFEKRNANITMEKDAEINRRKNGKGRLNDEELKALQPQSFKEACENRAGIGTLALRTNDMNMNGVQVYYLYKRRQNIEEFFKMYDDTLDFATSYMRNNYSEEAWLFMNHLSSLMAFKVMDEIYLRGKSKDISLKDFISTLSRIYADKINHQWYCAKMTKRRADFAKSFDFDISALIEDMNSMDIIPKS